LSERTSAAGTLHRTIAAVDDVREGGKRLLWEIATSVLEETTPSIAWDLHQPVEHSGSIGNLDRVTSGDARWPKAVLAGGPPQESELGLQLADFSKAGRFRTATTAPSATFRGEHYMGAGPSGLLRWATRQTDPIPLPAPA